MSRSRLLPNLPLLSLIMVLVLLTACDTLSSALPNSGVSVTVSTSADGSDPIPLEGAVLYGQVYLSVTAEAAGLVSVYLDDPAKARPPLETTQAPFVLPFAAYTFADGPHTLTLALTLTSGENQDVSAAFLVANLAGEMLGRVNAARASGYDCGEAGRFGEAAPLRLESRLMAAAQRQADDMNARGVLEHTGSDGSTVATRVSDAGYSWSRVGENLASGQRDVTEVVTAWLESDGHCRNVLGSQYRDLGVGRAGKYWVQVFAKP